MHVSQSQPPTGEPAAGERTAGSPPPVPGPTGIVFPPLASTAPATAPAAARSLYVPVRRGPAGTVLRLWRTPFGTRTAVGFTTDRRLRSVLGPCQPWIRLSETALRRMAEPLGTRHVTIDPVLTARPPAASSDAPCAHPAHPADRTADRTADRAAEPAPHPRPEAVG